MGHFHSGRSIEELVWKIKYEDILIYALQNHWSWNTSIVIWSNFLVSVTHWVAVTLQIYCNSAAEIKSECEEVKVRFWQGKKLIFIFYLWFGNEVDARTDVQFEAVCRIFTISPPKSSWRKLKSEIGARSVCVEYIWKTYEVARFLI